MLQLYKMKPRSTEPVSYVVAVSGGVDSVVLLHILARSLPAEQLVVAHFEHGIRDDSADDLHFVGQLADRYGLRFEFERAGLGKGASEALARQARYDFLRRTKDAHGATHIVTAHHENDVLETAIINLLRGTGRKGLSSLRSHSDLYRPLLSTPKSHIVAYAKKHGLDWHEDSTNASQDYLRNYVRQRIIPKFDDVAKARLRQIITSAHRANAEIDDLLAEQLQSRLQGRHMDRKWFILLPHAVAKEIMASWLRRVGIANFDRRFLEHIVVAAKTFTPGKRFMITSNLAMAVSQDMLTIVPREDT